MTPTRQRGRNELRSSITNRRVGSNIRYVPFTAQSPEMSQLTEVVAVSRFTKEMGHPPASPAGALKRYRALRGDTPDRVESEPLIGAKPIAPKPRSTERSKIVK